MMFDGLEKGKYGAILADPPWHFETWDKVRWHSSQRETRAAPYETMSISDMATLPVSDLCADNCILFIWMCWPNLKECLELIDAWGFRYKTCAFSWMKANNRQADMFREDADVQVGLGYWTRANSEACLLATRGKPKRLHADVRQGIIAPRREHSRKPDGIHERIERLVAGPYCELFARQKRAGWDVWGNQTDKFAEMP